MIREENNQISEIKKTDVYNEARILRDKNTKQALLEINTEGEWYMYAGNSVDNLEESTPIASGKDKGSYPLYIGSLERSYFLLVTNHGKAILAESHLPMTGGYNFRDLGGLRASDGRRVKWGKIFRSDDLYHLTEEDINYLSSIPIKTIVDFRCEEECNLLPDKFPASLNNYSNLEINPGSLQNFTRSSLSTENDAVNAMKTLYRYFVTEEEYVNKFREFFRLVQVEDELPLMFHCSAGKDRTGFAAAMLLKALDVPTEIIMRDYMQSNIYLEDKYKDLFIENPVNKYLYTVIPEYLEAAFDQIEEKYQDINSFLKNQLNVDIESLKNKLLY